MNKRLSLRVVVIQVGAWVALAFASGPSSCGLGVEIAALLPLLSGLQRRFGRAR
jgi:hypothetical protein